ncbi:MAG: F0F1 ATP synthase subunit A [Nitrospirota bacterium]
MTEGVASKPPEVANIITILNELWGDTSLVKLLHHFEDIFFAGIIIILLVSAAYLSTRKRSLIPGKYQNLMELIVETFDNFVSGILGSHGRRFTPFIGTLFLYIFFMNMLGLIPGMKSPSSNLNTTLALAIIVFLYVQYTGIKGLGIFGYIDHLMGRPRDIIGFLFIPLMFPLHIMGELIKPVSLSLRLFGNIMGEDALIAAFLAFGIVALSFIKSPVGIPLQLPFMLLAILTGTVQALVFSLLTTIYLFMMLPHHGGEKEEH